ncbi:SWIM zinc finger family protein [Pseudoduganella lurida]|uniref:SWIM zinc finger family protein n=1 Tax=Pseudoduganella lurida TaxID=1036180 RepID=UPI0011A3C625|nr:hypothetical protein [Pseudoduganella lurida]
MQFTPDDLRRQFDPGTFARGEDYARRGNVLSIRWEDGYVEGTVAGSGTHVYGVGIYLDGSRRGIAFDGDFTQRPPDRRGGHGIGLQCGRSAGDLCAAGALMAGPWPELLQSGDRPQTALPDRG